MTNKNTKLFQHVVLLLLCSKCAAFNNCISIRSSPLAPNQRCKLLKHRRTQMSRKTHLIQRASTLPMENIASSQNKSLLNKLRSMTEVQKWQAAATIFLSSLYFLQPQIDKMLVSVWSSLLHSSSLLPTMFRHDHWEWGLAVGGFFVWIHGFWICDYLCQKTALKGIRHPLRKYRLQDQWEAQKSQMRTHQRREPGVETAKVEELPMSPMNPWHSQAWIFEVPLYILPLYIWDKCIPRRGAKLALAAAPTTFQICSDVTLGLLLYDFGFFVCHYVLFHKIPFFYKAFHKKHHTNAEVRASDQVRLSLVEEVFDVGISILALRRISAHPFSRTIYNIIITFLLTELHSGYVFPWSPQEVVPFGLSTGSRRHHWHHRNGRQYYQKFFFTFDRIFGFFDRKCEEKSFVAADSS